MARNERERRDSERIGRSTWQASWYTSRKLNHQDSAKKKKKSCGATTERGGKKEVNKS